eukprot:scaffold2514_cov226-Alexandrium_tamarense.AAC.2
MEWQHCRLRCAELNVVPNQARRRRRATVEEPLLQRKLLLRVGTRMLLVNPRMIAVLVSIVSVDLVGASKAPTRPSKLLLRVGTRMMIVNPRMIAVLVSIVSVDFVLVVNKGEGKAGGDVRTSPPL